MVVGQDHAAAKLQPVSDGPRQCALKVLRLYQRFLAVQLYVYDIFIALHCKLIFKGMFVCQIGSAR